jgi:two-component SAPR family response regulator
MVGKPIVTAADSVAGRSTHLSDAPVSLRQPPLVAANPPSPLSDAVAQLSGAIESRLTQLDNQVASLRRLIVQPAATSEPLRLGAISAVANVLCLGPFSYRLGGKLVDDWRSGKARTLFQYLVTHRGRPIPRDTLIEALWPNPSASAPGTSLKVAVHLLRQVIARVGVPEGTSDSLEIVSQDSCYRLNAASLWLDVDEFESCYATGRSFEAHRKPIEALASYARAAELYRGDFLEDLSDEWPTFRREALKDQYLFILARLAAAAAEAGDYQDGIIWCQRLLARDRCREDTYRTLMLCHARLGQRSRVRSWYELCVRTLKTELDCHPEPETEQTYRLAMAGRL